MTEGECQLPQPHDPRVRRTRKLLEDAMRELLHERRFSEISVQDITERATVNRATFYAHYDDKQDLATAILKHDLHSTVLSQFESKPSLTRENLEQVACAIFEFLGGVYGACPETAADLEGMIGTTLQTELYSIMEHWVGDKGAQQRLFPHASKATVAAVLSWSIYGGAHRWSQGDRKVPAKEVCREIVSILLPAG